MLRSFDFLGITIYPYSVLMVIGAAVCLVLFLLISMKRHKENSAENLFATEMLVLSVAAALPAAMVVDSLFKIQENGGFVLKGATFYGGLIGALILFPLLLKIRKNRSVKTYDRLCDVAPCVVAGHFFGRIGCFLGGCCYGKPTDGIFGVVFPEGSLPYVDYGGFVAVHPTQLYEAALLLVLFVLLLFCRHWEFPLYLILYGTGRSVIECFRNDDRGFIAGIPLSPAQMISIVLIVLGVVIICLRVRQRVLHRAT